MSSDQSYCDAQLEVYTVADDDVKTLHSNYCVNAIYNKISVESHRVFLYLNLDYQLTFEGAILQYSTERKYIFISNYKSENLSSCNFNI